MIITRTPFRISFFGGGTDYPAWYQMHGGAVLATTINKYCYISCRYLPPFFEHKFRVVYSKMENVKKIEEIEHRAVREILRYVGISRGLEIHHDGDLPARSGIGSSSAFTVGLLHALYGLKGHVISKKELAKESIHIEQKILAETVGSQDQVLAAFGGLNHVRFLPSGEISVRPMTLKAERVQELNAYLMLFYTGIKRTASEIAESYVRDIQSLEQQLRLMNEMVDEGIRILNSKEDIVKFGSLLHEAWQAKRSFSAHVSNSDIDQIYEYALANGAIGGKLIGAGGGGFLLFFVRPSDRRQLQEKLSELLCIPFKFEFSGSHIIFFDREEEYSEEEAKGPVPEVGAFRRSAHS